MKRKIIVCSVIAVIALIFISAIAIYKTNTVKQSDGFESKITDKYGLDNLFKHFKITKADDVKVTEDGKTKSINFYGLNFSPVNFVYKSDLINNMREYVPYIDFFEKWPQTMIAGGCRDLSADVTLQIKPLDIGYHQALFTLQDKCFGHIELSMSFLNFSDKNYDEIKSDLLNLKFRDAANKIITDDIKVSATVQTFGKNYKEAAEAGQSDVIGKDKNLTIRTLKEYSDLMKKNNVNSDAQALNIKALERLVNISSKQWEDKERNIGLQIHFTDPVNLNKALEFIPNMVLSVQ